MKRPSLTGIGILLAFGVPLAGQEAEEPRYAIVGARVLLLVTGGPVATLGGARRQ